MLQTTTRPRLQFSGINCTDYVSPPKLYCQNAFMLFLEILPSRSWPMAIDSSHVFFISESLCVHTACLFWLDGGADGISKGRYTMYKQLGNRNFFQSEARKSQHGLCSGPCEIAGQCRHMRPRDFHLSYLIRTRSGGSGKWGIMRRDLNMEHDGKDKSGKKAEHLR